MWYWKRIYLVKLSFFRKWLTFKTFWGDQYRFSKFFQKHLLTSFTLGGPFEKDTLYMKAFEDVWMLLDKTIIIYDRAFPRPKTYLLDNNLSLPLFSWLFPWLWRKRNHQALKKEDFCNVFQSIANSAQVNYLKLSHGNPVRLDFPKPMICSVSIKKFELGNGAAEVWQRLEVPVAPEATLILLSLQRNFCKHTFKEGKRTRLPEIQI